MFVFVCVCAHHRQLYKRLSQCTYNVGVICACECMCAYVRVSVFVCMCVCVYTIEVQDFLGASTTCVK